VKKPLKVLLTGAFGNVGESTLLALLDRQYHVRCFDLPTKRNCQTQKIHSQSSSFETIWGDIRDGDLVRKAANGVDAIIHTAAIIPPQSDDNPELARQVNLEGTHLLIRIAESLSSLPKFIFTSSVAVYGHPMKLPPPRKVTDPIYPTDVYTEHKIQCEALLHESRLPWTICRLGVVTPFSLSLDLDPLMFEVPLDQRLEFVHTRDVGLALTNAITANATGKTLLIGGGKCCQMLYQDLVEKMLNAIGIGMIPESAFIQPSTEDEYFHTDWLDTTESQRLLSFQTRTYDQFVHEFQLALGYKRKVIRFFRPIARQWLLLKSPYYERH
jgi:nucleoside-diphosphate-sugar epimerase